jgi:hypothetical protein
MDGSRLFFIGIQLSLLTGMALPLIVDSRSEARHRHGSRHAW